MTTDDATEARAERIAKLKVAFRAKLQEILERKRARKKVRVAPVPIYDEAYFESMEWLDHHG